MLLCLDLWHRMFLWKKDEIELVQGFLFSLSFVKYDWYINNIFFKNFYSLVAYHYGNTGCRVFKRGIQNLKDCCLRINNLPKGNYWILSFWLMTSCQKVQKFDFQSQFSMSKIIQIFLNFHWKIPIYEHIFWYWHFLIKSIFKSLYY
jgi:hypothetical protein